MSIKNKEFKKYRLIQSLSHQSRSGNKKNLCKVWKGTSREHFITICEIVYKLVNQGYECYTECDIKGNRVDIAAISPTGEGFIIEVLKTEQDASYEAKLDKYDLDWTMVKVNCKDFDINKWEL